MTGPDVIAAMRDRGAAVYWNGVGSTPMLTWCEGRVARVRTISERAMLEARHDPGTRESRTDDGWMVLERSEA